MKELNELNLPDDVRYAEDHEWAAMAGDLAVEFALGRFDALTGRYIRVKDYKGDDLEQVEAQIPEILEKDLRTLRMR